MTLLTRIWRRRPPPLACQEVVELVTAYLEGALDAVGHARMAEHLDACDGCAAYVDQMRATLSLLGRIGPEDISPEAQRVLGEAFRAWRAGTPPDPGG